MRAATRVLAVVTLFAPFGAASVQASRLGGSPVALVTAETRNQLLAVSLPGGHVLRRIDIAADPETVAAPVGGPTIVVISPASGTVTLLAARTLRTLGVLRGFRSPQLAAIAPDGVLDTSRTRRRVSSR